MGIHHYNYSYLKYILPTFEINKSSNNEHIGDDDCQRHYKNDASLRKRSKSKYYLRIVVRKAIDKHSRGVPTQHPVRHSG